MAFVLKLTGVRRILEIGVFTGYSLNSMALALREDVIIVACDINDEYTCETKKFWHAVGVGSKIDLKLVLAMDLVHELSSHDNREPFGFVFIDADKENYSNY